MPHNFFRLTVHGKKHTPSQDTVSEQHRCRCRCLLLLPAVLQAKLARELIESLIEYSRRHTWPSIAGKHHPIVVPSKLLEAAPILHLDRPWPKNAVLMSIWWKATVEKISPYPMSMYILLPPGMPYASGPFPSVHTCSWWAIDNQLCFDALFHLDALQNRCQFLFGKPAPTHFVEGKPR